MYISDGSCTTARGFGALDYMEALETLTSEGIIDQWKQGVGHLDGGVSLFFRRGAVNMSSNSKKSYGIGPLLPRGLNRLHLMK